MGQGNWQVSSEHYNRTVRDPDGVEAEVTFRCLNTGDRVEITSRATKIVVEDTQDTEGQIDMGRFQFLSIQRAVVRWTLPFPCTEATLKTLRSDVFDQLWEFVSFDSVPEEDLDPLDVPSSEPSAEGV